MNSDRKLLADWLRAVPQSRHASVPLDSLPGGGIGRGLALLLETWGAVELTPAGGIRAVSQPAYYFLRSLAAWAETPGEVITDWSEEFGADADKGLQHGASLVHLLEKERLTRNPAADPIRFTAVAQILIIKPGDPPWFLTQWDPQAGKYQLIGGRQKVNRDWTEPIFDTAVREMEEEVTGGISYEARDFQVEELTSFSNRPRVSPTFGALTAYHFTFFRAFDLRSIQLGPDDLWVTRNDILTGTTLDGNAIRGDHILRLERILGRRIDSLPASFRKVDD